MDPGSHSWPSWGRVSGFLQTKRKTVFFGSWHGVMLLFRRWNDKNGLFIRQIRDNYYVLDRTQQGERWYVVPLLTACTIQSDRSPNAQTKIKNINLHEHYQRDCSNLVWKSGPNVFNLPVNVLTVSKRTTAHPLRSSLRTPRRISPTCAVFCDCLSVSDIPYIVIVSLS